MKLTQVLLFAAISCAVACGGSSQSAATEAWRSAVEPDGLYAVFQTSMGDVVCQLHFEATPLTVANFVGLASGEREFVDPASGANVKRPFYDGLKFHRVIANFMVQGGCPLGDGTGNPGYQFDDEIVPALKHDAPGVLSMANSGPGTNGSQFFITHVATPWLDGKHTVFGKVVYGMEIVNEMAGVPMTGAQNSTPVTDILLNKVLLVRSGAKAEAFDWQAAVSDYEAKQAQARAEQEAQEKTQMEVLAKTLGIDLATAQLGDAGLKWVVRSAGSGAKPTKGQTITAHYTGYLANGTKFDSSVDRGQPFSTPIGVGKVIKGWDLAFQDMQVGEKRVLIIPANLGYGSAGAGGVIPPNATLVFDVELIGIQ